MNDITWQNYPMRGDEDHSQSVGVCTFWLTGYSGAGKSTLAERLRNKMVAEKMPTLILDGDNIRHGLSRDLTFTPEDRRENIRRVSEVAKLFNAASMNVICALISPMRDDRAMARDIIGKRFIEVFVDCELSVCEDRDPKGLYKKARDGRIQEFTGISSPYEAPMSPELRVKTNNTSCDDCVHYVWDYLTDTFGIRGDE